MKKGFLVLMVVVMALGATALPALADDPGTGNSDFVIQNVASTATEVRVDYYDQTGASDVPGTPITLNGNGSQVFEASTLPVGDGWIGSVVVSADQQVAAITNLTWQSSYGSTADMLTGGTYAGTYEPGTELYFPYATVKPEGSVAGKLNRFSIITVQNAGTGDASINLYYYNQEDGSLTGPIADTIAAGRSKSYNLSLASDPMVPNLGGNWQGSVKVVSSNEPIAGVVTTHWAGQIFQQWASAYQGASGGATTLYAPSVFRVDRRTDPSVGTWVRSSNVMVQNLGGSNADVTIEFFETGNTSAAMTITDSIAPNTMGEYNTRWGSATNPTYDVAAFEAALGTAFNGSVKITCTNGQNLASVVHSFWNRGSENAASTYQAVAGPGSTDVYIPYAPRKWTTSGWVQWSKIAIQNLSASAANITLNYYNPDGTSALVVNDTIAGSSGDAYNTRFGSDGGTIPGTTFAGLGDNFIGGVHISSTQSLAAVVNLISNPSWSSTYNAYTE